MSNELMTRIEANQTAVEALRSAAKQDKGPELQIKFMSLVAGLISGIPGLAPLAEFTVNELVSRSAPGQLRAALNQLREEESEEAQRKAIAAAVAELLSEALDGLKEGQEGLKRRLDALEKRNGAVRIRQREVSDGVGTQVKNNATRDVDIEQGHIRGGIGVIIGD